MENNKNKLRIKNEQKDDLNKFENLQIKEKLLNCTKLLVQGRDKCFVMRPTARSVFSNEVNMDNTLLIY